MINETKKFRQQQEALKRLRSALVNVEQTQKLFNSREIEDARISLVEGIRQVMENPEEWRVN